MIELREIYKERFFARRYKLSWRAPVLFKVFTRVLKFQSYMDVGCATGDIVGEFQKNGYDAEGIEGSDQAIPYFEAKRIHVLDMRIPVNLGRTFDFVSCLEVVEHIEPEYEEQFIDNLIGLAHNWLLISAAPPGQGGHYHVNCQPEDYWVDKFRDKGFMKHDIGTSLLKHYMTPWKNKDGIKAFYQNIILFRDER